MYDHQYARSPGPTRSTQQTPGYESGGGGGGTDSLRLGTNCESDSPPPPLFDKGQPLELLSSNLQPPLFMDTQEQPL